MDKKIKEGLNRSTQNPEVFHPPTPKWNKRPNLQDHCLKKCRICDPEAQRGIKTTGTDCPFVDCGGKSTI